MNRLNLKILFASCLTGIMAMTSCNNYSDELPEVQEKRVKLSVTAVETFPDTRAIKEGTSFVKGDTIGLFVMKYTKEQQGLNWSPYTTEEECFNVPAVYDGSQWKVLRDIYLTNEYAEIAAYYPYNKYYKFTHKTYPYSGSITSIVGGNIYTDTPCDILPHGSNNDQADIMMGSVHSQSVNDSHPEAQILFSHSLYRLTFSLLRAEDFKYGQLTKATLRGAKGFYKYLFLNFWYEGEFLQGHFSSVNSNFASYYTEEISLDTPLGADALSTTERSNIDFLVDPVSFSGLQLILQFGDKEYTIDLPKVSLQTTGYQHTFPITIHGDGN